MRSGFTIALAGSLATTVISVPVQAESREVIQPIPLGDESVRFDRGEYLIDLPGKHAAVQIRSMPSDHGYLSFMVVVLNTGPAPFNIDIGNIRVEGTAKPVRLLTAADMVQKAENRAFWAKLATALTATQRTTYYGTISTPYSWATVQVSAPCYSCQAAAAEHMAAIEGYLDETRRQFGNRMLQVNTVDPGRGYAGQIFLNRFDRKPMSEMRLVVSIEGEDFAFGFRFATAGTPLPAFRTIAPAPVAPVQYLPPAAPPPQQLSAPRPMTVSATAPGMPAPMPAPRSAAVAQSPHVSPDTERKWKRYYTTLIESGETAKNAKAMANQEFGSID